MPSRPVTGTIRTPEGEPWPEFVIDFTVQPSTFTTAANFPEETVSATTDVAGMFAIDLEAGLQYTVGLRSIYIVTGSSTRYPSGSQFTVVVPTGTEPISLETLRAASGVSVTEPTIVDFAADHLGSIATVGALGHVVPGATVTVAVNGSLEIAASVQTDIDSRALSSVLTSHTGNTANPHTVTKGQVGLASVPNVDATQRASHVGTQSADTLTDGITNKAFLATDETKLDGIEAGADVTDAENVNPNLTDAGINAAATTINARLDSVQTRANVRDYQNLVGVDGYWDAAFAAAQNAAYEVYVPEGTYPLASWVPMRSHRRWHGDGALSVIANDKSNADVQRQSCFLPGLHHPALMAAQTSYVLNAIAAGDPVVTCTTAGDAANATVGQLVIVGSATNISGVSRHAQLNKVSAISGGAITLVDPIEQAISDGRIWTITGTDASSGQAIYAVENLIIEDLAFSGRSALATKGCVFGGAFRNLHMLDTHTLFATNMLTNVLVENITGQFSGRFIETAMNSYNVIFRNIKARFRPPTGLQAGEAMVLPIHLGEQPYRVLLDQVQCHVDGRFTVADQLIQVKGSEITFRNADFRHGGSNASSAIAILDSAFAGNPYRNILFENTNMAAPGKVRIAHVGGSLVADTNPVGVHFRGGELQGSVTGESIWFQAGKNLSCSMLDLTGKTIKVQSTAQYPMLNGYRRG